MKERIDRLDRLVEGNERWILKNYPMLKVLRCIWADQLEVSIKNYIGQTIQEFHGATVDLSGPDYVYNNSSWLESLPNITPNGLILPKKETFLAYNQVHRSLVNILNNYDLGSKIDKIHAPINIRLVKGSKDLTDQRPRASSKIHTDIWAGEPAGALLCAMVVGGDWTASTVRYIEPTSFPEDMLKPLADYNEGKHVSHTGEHYDTLLDNSGLFIMDSYLLHQTLKLREGYRLSIDFRFIPKDTVESDRYNSELRTENYMSYDEWASYGTTSILHTADLLEAYKGTDTTLNAYACTYTTVKL